MTNWRFDWRSYLLGIGTPLGVIVVAALMVSVGTKSDPQFELDLTSPQPNEETMPEISFKVLDPNNFCFYHDHEIESRVYVGLEEYGPICEEAAEELSGPLVLEGDDDT